jgi:hypothetical protein
VSERTCRKWLARYRAEGPAGLLDRSSAPHSVPHRTPDELVEVIVLLRRLRMTGAEIAFCLAMALSTVSAVLARVGLGKLSRLAPREPPNRYERRHAGELIHVDVKKLGRIEGGAGHRVASRRRGNPRKTNAAGQVERQVGWGTCTSASTTPAGWPTSRSSATRRARQRSRSCAARSRSTARTA